MGPSYVVPTSMEVDVVHLADGINPTEAVANYVDSFAVGVDLSGAEYVISISGDGTDGLFLLDPEQASLLAGMLLAALAKHGREPTNPSGPATIN